MPKRKLPDALFDENDIENMIKACYHPRDAALISFLYESGCRKGEMLGLTIKSVTFDDKGAVVTFPEGKTGSRRILIIYAASFLRTWIESHPRKDIPENPLFCSLRSPDKALSETGLHNQLKDVAKRAGIKKRIYPHLMRHSRASKLAKHLTEQELKTVLGWTAGSNMAATYVHLSGQDIDPSIMRMYGLDIPIKQEGELKVFQCPRCKRNMPVGAAFCSVCGLPISDQLKVEEAATEMDILDIIASNPQNIKKLHEMLKNFKE